MSNQQDKEWRDSEPFEHKRYKNFYQLAGGIFLTVIVLLIGGFIYSQPESGYWVNIYATIVGTVLTIAVLDRRAEHRTIHERKEELILQMGSPDNGFAVEAARILKQKGWLFDGTLIKARLSNADLTDAFLHSANLSSAYLQGAELNEAILAESNLENAFMRIASLKNANLFVANLTGANLTEADLFGANLFGANLQKANLYGANFRGADLRGANLKDAIIKETVFIDAKFNEATILPDGKKWGIDHDIYANYSQTDEW